jgi:hypothetical protein
MRTLGRRWVHNVILGIVEASSLVIHAVADLSGQLSSYAYDRCSVTAYEVFR